MTFSLHLLLDKLYLFFIKVTYPHLCGVCLIFFERGGYITLMKAFPQSQSHHLARA